MQYGPGQACIPGGNGDHRAPVAAAFGQAAGPAAEAVLFVADAVEDGTGAHDEQTSQVVIAGFGDAPQSGFATAAVLAGCQPDPGCDLTAVPEVVAVADAGQECAGGDGPMPGRSIKRRLRASSRAACEMAWS